MEDPWANAWKEPTKPEIVPWTHAQQPETDIVPSWANGTDVKWAEPSDTPQSLWNSQLPVKEWNSSTYDLGTPSQDELSQHNRSLSPATAEEISPNALEPASFPDDEEPPITRSRPPTPESESPSTPDAFGTFESGLDVDGAGVDPWGHSTDLPTQLSRETDTWREYQRKAEVEAVSETVDEWEAAKQKKERQDRHVPPEVLNSILGQFEELANELWPNTTQDNNTNITDFRHERENGIEGIEGIKDVVNRLIPRDLTLPQHVQFSKTFTSKYMSEALRLTRHIGTMRSSPMALYMASKGSMAWETLVKSRPEVLKDDLLPPGWKIIEKEEPAATDNKKKTSGGLLSFFGRRGNLAPSSEANPKLLESSVRPVRTPPPGATDISSPRASADSVQSSATGSVTSLPFRLSSTSVTESSDPAFNPTPPPASSPAAPLPPQGEISEAAPSTSAVSRFLNRFSRNKSSSSIQRNSLALSSDDIEFLSDIVPSANEEEDEDFQLKGLSNMIASSPLPTKLPPPLAPPPRGGFRSKSPTLNGDLLSLSSSISLEALNISQIQETSIKPVSLSYPVVTVEPSSTTPSSTLTQSSFIKTGPSPGSTFTSSPASSSHTPLPSKRTPMAIMSTSSVTPTGSSFNFPPPPSSSTQPLVLPLPPSVIGPASKSLSSMPSTGAETYGSMNGDEYFYQPPLPTLAALDTSVSSAFSDDSLVHTSLSTATSYSKDLFDDFDDFVSSPLRSPSPPLPPQKPTSFGHKPTPSQQLAPPSLRSISPDKPQPPLPPPKTSRAADHQRTMSLLENAAARPGRWPAPPSPLPDAIPPPEASEPSFDNDLFAGGSTMQNQQINAIAGLGASVSSPASFSLEASASRLPFLPPAPSSTLTPSPVSPPIQPKQQSSMRIPVTSPGSATSGGLSAQDLSFFEGL